MNCLNSLKSLNSLKNLSSFSYNKKLFSTLTSSTNLTSTANYLSSKGDLQLHYDIITEEQEKTLLKVLNNLLVKRRYEKNHWDSVINHYKEIELNYKEEEFSSLSSLHEETKKILLFIEEFIHQHVDSEGKMKILPPHVIDIRKDGNIGAHVDSIKFSGCLISGLSLNCERIMKLTKVDPSELPYDGPYEEILNNELLSPPEISFRLPPRSLYCLKGIWRYHYKHEILEPQNQEEEKRRVSIIFRDDLSTKYLN